MADPNIAITLVKAVHVIFASLWTGGAAYASFVLAPNLAASSPAVRAELGAKMGTLGVKLGNALGGFTILTGAVLYYLQRGTAVRSYSDRLILFGSLVALAVLYLLNTSTKPALKRIGEMAKEMRPGDAPELMMVLLQKRLRFTGALMVGMLATVAAFMVAANTGLLD